MTDDALRALFASTERNGRSVPEDAVFYIDHYDACTEVVASLTVRGKLERFGFRISQLVAIRAEGAEAYRDPADVAEQIRKSVISLAYASIDAVPPQRLRARPFVARVV